MKKFLFPLLFVLACSPGNSVDTPRDPGDSVSVPPGEVVVVEPVPAPDSLPTPEDVPDFCHPGTACDTAGDPVLARLVDPSRSTITMRPDNKLFVPGDKVEFELCAFQTDGTPVAGVPAVAVVKQTRRQIAGDGLSLTEADGCKVVEGTFVEEDQIGDPNTPEPDSGSYIVNGYLGGRVINPVEVLYDTW